MNKVLLGVAVLVSGLFFCCPKVEANDPVLPKAGFSKWESALVYDDPAIYILTDEEKDLLLRIGVHEGGETDPDAIAYVMQTVMNRVEDESYPNTVEEVIFQKKQFTSARKLASANITDEAYEALYGVIMGDYVDCEALYFESLPGIVWGNIHEYQFSYGGHDFYK